MSDDKDPYRLQRCRECDRPLPAQHVEAPWYVGLGWAVVAYTFFGVFLLGLWRAVSLVVAAVR